MWLASEASAFYEGSLRWQEIFTPAHVVVSCEQISLDGFYISQRRANLIIWASQELRGSWSMSRLHEWIHVFRAQIWILRIAMSANLSNSQEAKVCTYNCTYLFWNIQISDIILMLSNRKVWIHVNLTFKTLKYGFLELWKHLDMDYVPQAGFMSKSGMDQLSKSAQ